MKGGHELHPQHRAAFPRTEAVCVQVRNTSTLMARASAKHVPHDHLARGQHTPPLDIFFQIIPRERPLITCGANERASSACAHSLPYLVKILALDPYQIGLIQHKTEHVEQGACQRYDSQTRDSIN